jgi:hypothetical protein
MKQRLILGGVFLILILAMIGLNAASYVQKEKRPDTEISPNRSSYNTGATGTHAFFTFLAETGRRVTKWQRPPADLLTEAREQPAVFVIAGPLRREFEKREPSALLQWVFRGGRLVVIDRDPPRELFVTTAEWSMMIRQRESFMRAGVDPADQVQMTSKTKAARPVLPTVLTAGVNAVQPSRFASDITFQRYPADGPEDEDEIDPYPYEEDLSRFETMDEMNGGPDVMSSRPDRAEVDEASFRAPLVHFRSDDLNLVVEVPYGAGQIVFLSDPFVVSNGGISLVDNATLALNLVNRGPGLIAFDEYHHGFGAGRNRMVEYFSGTPVIAIFLQLAAIAAFVMYSRSRRFARPVPAAESDRLSKLEYVSAMAELQRRSGAFDLAIENIYGDFRRRAGRLFGIENSPSSKHEASLAIAERTGADAGEIEALMQRCEDIMHGETTGKGETVTLTARIREIENALKLSRGRRDRV